MFWLFSYDTTGWKAELRRSFIIKRKTTLDLSIVRFCYIPPNSTQTPWGWQTGQSLSQNHALPLSFWDALGILGETKRHSSFFSSRCGKSVTFSGYSNFKLSPTSKDSCLGGEGGNGQENAQVLFHSEQDVDVVRFPRRGSKLGRRQGKEEGRESGREVVRGRNQWGECVTSKD